MSLDIVVLSGNLHRKQKLESANERSQNYQQWKVRSHFLVGLKVAKTHFAAM